MAVKRFLKERSWISWLIGFIFTIGVSGIVWIDNDHEGQRLDESLGIRAHVSNKTFAPAPLPSIGFTITPTSTTSLGIGSSRERTADGMLMMYVPAGEFLMGEDISGSVAQPAHIVYTDAYWIDQTEVTNTMFTLFLREMGNQVEGGVLWMDELGFGHIYWNEDGWMIDSGFEDHPVIEVTWYGAQSYCSWAGVRLPTEAEWEKAALGGLEGAKYPWGEENPSCEESAVNGAQFNACEGSTVPVGSFSPNGYGLYDMAGNVWEWIVDWYDSSFYRSSPSMNPQCYGGGSFRVQRGGSWFNDENSLRLAHRGSFYPFNAHDSYGFRCADDVTH